MIDVVYIDDEPSLLRVCKLVLESLGLSVATFEHAGEALEFIGASDVGVILCDYRMPDMNGLDVLRSMKVRRPFFLVSGDIQIEELTKGEPGLSGFLCKPLSFIGIAELVRNALNEPS